MWMTSWLPDDGRPQLQKGREHVTVEPAYVATPTALAAMISQPTREIKLVGVRPSCPHSAQGAPLVSLCEVKVSKAIRLWDHAGQPAERLPRPAADQGDLGRTPTGRG